MRTGPGLPRINLEPFMIDLVQMIGVQTVVSGSTVMDLPHVSSEGGPIILGDFKAVRAWRGASDASDDYEKACQLLERSNPSPLVFGQTEAVIWDFEGPGTGDIVMVSECHISVVRIWPDESWTDDHTASVVLASATDRFGASVMADRKS